MSSSPVVEPQSQPSLPQARPVVRLPGTNAVVFGRRGSGKTSLVRSLLPHHSRVLVVDPHREYAGVAVEVQSFEELATYLARTDGRWRVAYFNNHLESDFDQLCLVAWELGNTLLVVEEVDRFCDPHTIPDPFYAVINYGRHAPTGPVDFLAVSRTPVIHHTLTREAYEVYSFTIQEPRDLDYISKLVSEEFAEGLQDVPVHHFRYKDLYDRAKPMEERKL